MRRITLTCLAWLLILLGLIRLAAAQNISIQLTPQNPPIQIPSQGGSFDYIIAAINNGTTTQQAAVWCMVTLPNGNPYGPVLGPVTIILSPGQTQDRLRTQDIPQEAPLGTYVFNANVGIYPDTVWDSDSFPFEKLSTTPGGLELWVERYNGPGNSGDYAYSIAVDAAGNVYVTGHSWGGWSGMDYATIKYNSAGISQWVARYNGGTVLEGADYAKSLAVDAVGNIYVTGFSAAAGSGFDYATIKYDSNGNQLWVARYDGGGGDYAYSLALDPAGNIYVAGGSAGDFATIKYDVDGNQIWVARYDWGTSASCAYSLALDAAGNSYVTGYRNLSGTDADYATVKFDTAGNQIWAASYDGPGWDTANSIAADGIGNAYVTGNSADDYATIKYDANGNQVWVARYDGQGGDEARSIAVDGAGHIYVTGNSAGDMATIKYDADGNQIWVARYNGPGSSSDQANSLVLDATGNVYVAGYSSGVGTGEDFTTLKYDPEGNELWVAFYDGPGDYNHSDQANSLALDASGNAYVTGISVRRGLAINYDYCTIKYSGGNLDNWMPVEASVLGPPLPQECRLEPNYPNPFNATTALCYLLPANGRVRLKIYDSAGCLIESLMDGWRLAGVHELTWDAGDLPSGMYFARLEAGEYMEVQKMVLLK